MKLTALALALAVASLPVVAGQTRKPADSKPTAGVTLPPRTTDALGMERPHEQDSNLRGGGLSALPDWSVDTGGGGGGGSPPSGGGGGGSPPPPPAATLAGNVGLWGNTGGYVSIPSGATCMLKATPGLYLLELSAPYNGSSSWYSHDSMGPWQPVPSATTCAKTWRDPPDPYTCKVGVACPGD